VLIEAEASRYQNSLEHGDGVLALKLLVVGEPVDQLHHQGLKQLPRHLATTAKELS